MALKAFVFDMDGVIVDSEALQVEAERWVCDRFGLRVPEDMWMTFKGRTNESIFKQILRICNNDSVPVDALIGAKRGHYLEIAKDRLTLVPGALRFLARAKAQVGKCALVTSSSSVVRAMVFNKFALHSYFDQVVTGDQVSIGKPHPEPYLLAMRKLGIDPNEACVLEDSDNGIRSAVSAGCHAIGITTSFSRDVLVAHGAHHVVDSYEEMYQLLDNFMEEIT